MTKRERPILNEITIDFENIFLSKIDLLMVSNKEPILNLIFFKTIKKKLVKSVKMVNEINKDIKI